MWAIRRASHQALDKIPYGGVIGDEASLNHDDFCGHCAPAP
jgi:hypothetical protein